MKFVDVKCPNCGASIQVDKQKDASICEKCGEPFVVEKAIIKNENKHINSNKVNSNKIIACFCGYFIDFVLIFCSFFCEASLKIILLSYVTIIVITCIIVKKIKKKKINENMAIFIGKWSLYVSMFILGIIVELIGFIFEVNILSNILEKIEKN